MLVALHLLSPFHSILGTFVRLLLNVALLEEIGSDILLAHDLAEVLPFSDGVRAARSVASGSLLLLDLDHFRFRRDRGLMDGLEVDLLRSGKVIVMGCGCRLGVAKEDFL